MCSVTAVCVHLMSRPFLTKDDADVGLLGCYCIVFCFCIISFIIMFLLQLSENVIDRMKESSPSGSKSQQYSSIYGASGMVAFLF